jgi:hypothetical protein
VAPHPPHDLKHPLIQSRPADLLTHQVSLDGDHLDHVSAQDCEVLFRRRLYGC